MTKKSSLSLLSTFALLGIGLTACNGGGGSSGGGGPTVTQSIVYSSPSTYYLDVYNPAAIKFNPATGIPLYPQYQLSGITMTYTNSVVSQISGTWQTQTYNLGSNAQEDCLPTYNGNSACVVNRNGLSPYVQVVNPATGAQVESYAFTYSSNPVDYGTSGVVYQSDANSIYVFGVSKLYQCNTGSEVCSVAYSSTTTQQFNPVAEANGSVWFYDTSATIVAVNTTTGIATTYSNPGGEIGNSFAFTGTNTFYALTTGSINQCTISGSGISCADYANISLLTNIDQTSLVYYNNYLYLVGLNTSLASSVLQVSVN